MSLFDPPTFSNDWEILIVDEFGRCVSDQKLLGFAGILRAELDMPVQVDRNSLEFALGINTSFQQMWQRVQSITERGRELVREYGLDVFPAGAHPVEWMFSSAHVHVGTVHDEPQAIWLENMMMRYVPVFGAMAANSPVAHGLRGEFKSYRMRHLAYGATCPSGCRTPGLTQPTWYSDAAPKLYCAPTVEVRVPDCSSSRRFVVELSTLIAAHLHHWGARITPYTPSEADYTEFLTNRWAAAKYGLQATLMWNGMPRPVADIVREMLDECCLELATLGVSPSNLTTTNLMLEKRYCQADFAADIAERYPDNYEFASAYGKLIRHWDIFEEYLDAAPALDPVPPPDAQTILNEHLSFVGEGTHYYKLREAMCYPPTAADAILERLTDAGYVRQEVLPSGIHLHRLK